MVSGILKCSRDDAAEQPLEKGVKNLGRWNGCIGFEEVSLETGYLSSAVPYHH